MPSSLPVHKPFHLVDHPTALRHCLREISTHNTIAFDLEFDSHSHAYGVTLCLVQVATPTACYIIDPLACIDLTGLYAIFEDERILKIVHSPGEDLRLLHALQCFPKNLFDTEVTARLLNYEHTSLSSMLQAKLGYTMSKQQQRSNWLRRPLTPEQIQYAADDVASLHMLKDLLEDEAAQKSLMPFVLEEQQALSTTIYRAEPKDCFLKPADLRMLSPYAQYVLNALFVYRDGLARQLHKPAYQVMDEGTVRALAGGTLLPADLPATKGLWGSYKNDRFAAALAVRLHAIHAEADSQALSRDVPVRERLSAVARAARAAADQDKAGKFAPLQTALAGRFGAHAARFILSNGAVNDLLKQKMTISGLKRQYRQMLIRSIAEESGIDLSRYE